MNQTEYKAEKARDRARQWYYDNKKRVKEKYVERESQPENVIKRNRAMAERTKKWKNIVFDRLGGKCVKCGFSDHRALQIDHINGKGCHIRAGKSRSYCSYYRLLAISPDTLDNFQLLCANCNWIKRYEKQEVKTNIFDKS